MAVRDKRRSDRSDATADEHVDEREDRKIEPYRDGRVATGTSVRTVDPASPAAVSVSLFLSLLIASGRVSGLRGQGVS